MVINLKKSKEAYMRTFVGENGRQNFYSYNYLKRNGVGFRA